MLRWGILGTGMIARVFAKAVNESSTGTLHGIGSREQASADAFAGEFQAARAYGSYDALLEDPDIEAIYLSLPNHLHLEWIEKCAAAGKHLLAEKPLTVNAAEAERARRSVEAAGIFHLEAFMYRCHPQTRKLVELVRDGAVGEVRLIQASFSYNLGPRYDNIRLSNPAAGGGIMDVGCYTASFARLVAGEEPQSVTGAARIGERSRVDEAATAALKFPSGIVAALSCGCQVAVASDAYVWGSEGSLRVPNPWFPGEGDNRLLLSRPGKEPEDIVVSGEGRGLYVHEADLVAQCLAEGRTEAPAPAMTWDDTIGNMRTLDAWRRSVGLVFDAEKD